MAPAKTAKRAAAQVVEGPRKRRGVQAASPMELIQAALLRAEVPEHVRQLLHTVVQPSLSGYKEDRHPFQQTVIGFVAEALDGLHAASEKAVAGAEAKLGATRATEEERLRTKEVAESALSAANAKTTEKVQGLAAAAQHAKETAAGLKAAEVAEKAGNKDLDAAAKKKAALQSALEASLVPLKTTAPNGSERKRLLSSLLAVSKANAFDPCLVETLPAVLAKPLEERAEGSFGHLVLQHTEEVLAKKIGELDAQLQAGEAGRAERAAAVAAARAAAEGAQVLQEAAVAAMTAAKEAEQAREAELEAASKAVDSFASEVDGLQKELERAKGALEELCRGALAAFAELRDAAPPAVPVEPEAAPAHAKDVDVPAEDVDVPAAAVGLPAEGAEQTAPLEAVPTPATAESPLRDSTLG